MVGGRDDVFILADFPLRSQLCLFPFGGSGVRESKEGPEAVWRTLDVESECGSQEAGVQGATRTPSNSQPVPRQETNCTSAPSALPSIKKPMVVTPCQRTRSISCSFPLSVAPLHNKTAAQDKTSSSRSFTMSLCVTFLCHVPCMLLLRCVTPVVGVAWAGGARSLQEGPESWWEGGKEALPALGVQG